MKRDNVEAAVTIEPGAVPFPAFMSREDMVYGRQVPDEEFAEHLYRWLSERKLH